MSVGNISVNGLCRHSARVDWWQNRQKKYWKQKINEFFRHQNKFIAHLKNASWLEKNVSTASQKFPLFRQKNAAAVRESADIGIVSVIEKTRRWNKLKMF